MLREGGVSESATFRVADGERPEAVSPGTNESAGEEADLWVGLKGAGGFRGRSGFTLSSDSSINQRPAFLYCSRALFYE
ncbi:hypothetical protein SAMN05443661_10237 [Natronobacterium gregoryi]|uniref:Uncharacterized protein n=2 Tax=Natronobacterium gregoryi TaxID=44930 RepID=L0AJ84_NATGS|nr:hypothetical protein Natgr_2044 [Natronobacterium gregoryi SP2]ELY71315.1 hypothetical protein C490_05272 [Natronobacterium gregoryi SP2]PLK21635.1 hypothetical protein CYV19_03495 [Natronobacterium gregoryi SP2]SFI57978.1 hypothetical protein SAMN05443661_10237 [Natronobacterium gregoryi]